MALAVRWRNFRGFDDTGVRSIAPLTVLIGPNNSGKTSFIAPLLLLQQTLDAVNSDTALLTRGDVLDFGHYIDLVRNHDTEAHVDLTVEWHVHGTAKDARQPLGMYPPGAARIRFFQDETGGTRLFGLELFDTFRRSLLKRERLPSGKYSLTGLKAIQSPMADDDPPASGARQLAEVRRAIRDSKPTGFFFDGTRPMLDVAMKHARHPEDSGAFTVTADADREGRLYSLVMDTARYALTEELRDLTYIGPLREPARRMYSLSGEMPRNVGTRGEHAPEVLFRWRENEEKRALVDKWLSRFGFTDELELSPEGPGAFSLAWKTEAQVAGGTAFVDMGFGLSQVLPLIVQGVMAPPGTTLVAEQPEIHLNPRLQSVLAELFAFFVSRGVNVVVETHSEHLLLTLRRIVAENLGSDDAPLNGESIAIYFVERTAQGTSIRSVPVTDDGDISPSDWPEGFFGDALRESLALAAAQFERGG